MPAHSYHPHQRTTITFIENLQQQKKDHKADACRWKCALDIYGTFCATKAVFATFDI